MAALPVMAAVTPLRIASAVLPTRAATTAVFDSEAIATDCGVHHPCRRASAGLAVAAAGTGGVRHARCHRQPRNPRPRRPRASSRSDAARAHRKRAAHIWSAVHAGRDPSAGGRGAAAPVRLRAQRGAGAHRVLSRAHTGSRAAEVRRRGPERSVRQVLGGDADLLPGASGRSVDRRRDRGRRGPLGGHRALGLSAGLLSYVRLGRRGPSPTTSCGSHCRRRSRVAVGCGAGGAMDYRDYQHLTFERREHGVVLITINRPEVLNATNDRLHWELTQVWLTFDADEAARVAVVTGAGRAFSAGGDLEMVDANARDPRRLARMVREASDL